MDKTAFFTREAANAGIRLPLVDPRTGKETDQWIHIVGRDSDVFHKAEVESQRRLVESVKGLEPGNKAAVESKLSEVEEIETLSLRASLVTSWSFDEPCTREAVKEFLREAPQIADAIDKVAVKRRLFFSGVSTDSTDTPKHNSGSTSPSKEESKPSESAPSASGSKPAKSPRS